MWFLRHSKSGSVGFPDRDAKSESIVQRACTTLAREWRLQLHTLSTLVLEAASACYETSRSFRDSSQMMRLTWRRCGVHLTHGATQLIGRFKRSGSCFREYRFDTRVWFQALVRDSRIEVRDSHQWYHRGYESIPFFPPRC